MLTQWIAGPVAGFAMALAGAGPAAAAPAGGYADLVEAVAPAVVFIEVTATAEAPSPLGRLPFGEGTPLEDFFERFGLPLPDLGPLLPEGGSAPQPMTGVGSGFIIEADGTIVTNNHVVAEASEVSVRLGDGRSFEAEVVGTDPMTDLAVLRIDAGGDLPTVAFGDSAAVRPGDNVIVVGNPFGLGGSVTAGIVSAVARDISAGPYDDFIQLDAAINRGNSGGPVFNEAGEVIGVATAIFSPTGGSVGIGFAVPSNLARSVIDELEATGTVERGWLGVRLQPLNDELADALGLDAATGALVAEVLPDGPAAAAGVEAGDVIRRFDGQPVEDGRALTRLVAAADPGASVPLEVIRGGAERSLTVTLVPLDPGRFAAAGAPGGPGAPGATGAPQLGLELAPLDAEARERLGLPADVQGVIVAAVDPEGPAAGELSPGDVVLSVQNEAVASPEELVAALEAAEGREAVLLKVRRGDSERFVGLRLADG